MAKKKKKGKKAKKTAQKQIHDLSLKQLINQINQNLKAEKPREAISNLKFAGKKYSYSDEINTLLFRAYLMREKQLRSKNLHTEADAVKKQALEYRPDFDIISEQDMTAYVMACSVKGAFVAYKNYLAKNKPSNIVEQNLANHLIQHNIWDALEDFDDDILLKRDSLPVKNAVDLMNQGKWEKTLEMLRPISRTSPYAPVRMFCRAMVLFYKDDDKTALRLLSMIPDNFALSNVVRHIKNFISQDSEPRLKKEAAEHIKCLWDGPVNLEKDINELIYCLEKKHFARARALIYEISESIYPEDSEQVSFFIFEILWSMVLQYKLHEYDLQKLVKNILSAEQSELFIVKASLQDPFKPFLIAGNYISMLDKEFPDSGKRKIAHAQVILYTATKIYTENNQSKIIQKDKAGIKKYSNLLGIKSKKLDMILIEMTAESIRLDPYNRKAYELLVNLPRPTRAARKIVDAALNPMLGYFPDDPFPCLELATLYYENNAFRKAENILKEAMKRAPHDNRVIDRHAIALIISSEKNIQRKNFHLVERDLQTAQELESKNVYPFIIEKRIIFKLVQSEDDLNTSKKKKQFFLFGDNTNLNKIISEEIDHLSLFEQLRVLSILIPDIKHLDIKDKKNILKNLEKRFDIKLKDIYTLSSPEVIKLLAPLPREYAGIVNDRKIATIFFKKNNNILSIINQSEIIDIYDLILEPALYKIIKKDIKQRLNNANKRERIFLKFYFVSIQHLAGEKESPDLFYDIVDEVEDGPVREELRAVSRKLSKHAKGYLKQALAEFDFDILDDAAYFPSEMFDDDDDFFPPFLDQDNEPEPGNFFDFVSLLGKIGDLDGLEDLGIDPNELISEAEGFVDRAGIRDAPTFLIKEMRQVVLKSEPAFKRDLDMMAQILEEFGLKAKLSREAQLVLFGKSQKKR